MSQTDPRDALHHAHRVIYRAGRRMQWTSDDRRSMLLTTFGNVGRAVARLFHAHRAVYKGGRLVYVIIRQTIVSVADDCWQHLPWWNFS